MMKIKKLILVSMIVCLAGAAGLLFYQKRFRLSPAETVENQLDAIFKENGLENGQEKAKLAELFMDKIQKTQLACALSDPAEHQEKFFENIMPGLQMLNYEVTEISKSEDQAEVLVSINSFKLPEIVQNGQEKFGEEMEKEGSLSTEEMIEKLYEVIANEFQKGPSDDSTATVTVTLHKKDHKWRVDDKFEDEIFDAILRQD